MDTFIITCEHGGNRVPAPYRRAVSGPTGIAGLPSRLGSRVRWSWRRHSPMPSRAPLVAPTTSRLLIDLNRSIGHPQLFSVATRGAPRSDASADRRAALPALPRAGRAACRPSRIARPSRDPHFVAQLHPRSWTARCAAPTWVCSTTPAGAGRPRCARAGRNHSRQSTPGLRVRRNYPYAGRGDGLTSHLRRRFTPSDYVGIELEVNQGLVFAAGRRWTALRRTLIDSLHPACAP